MRNEEGLERPGGWADKVGRRAGGGQRRADGKRKERSGERR